MKFALVRNNVVEAIREGLTEAEIADLGRSYQGVVDITNEANTPDVGWTLYGTSFVPPPGVEGSVKITKLAFRNRFTMQEKATLYVASQTQQGLPLRIYLDDLAVATYVDLLRADTIASIHLLAQLGIIAADRVSQVLSTTVTEEERYRA